MKTVGDNLENLPTSGQREGGLWRRRQETVDETSTQWLATKKGRLRRSCSDSREEETCLDEVVDAVESGYLQPCMRCFIARHTPGGSRRVQKRRSLEDRPNQLARLRD